MRNLPLFIIFVVSQVFWQATNVLAESYPIMCRGGGNMTARMGSSGGTSLMIEFGHAPQGYLTQKPGKGQCAWSDRAMNDKEPGVLLLHDASSMGATLMNQIKGGYFSVNAFNTGGVLEITSVNILDDNESNDTESAKQRPTSTSSQPDDLSSDADFSGRWESQTDDGDEFTLDLEQNGKIVRGTYRSSHGGRGTIRGAIKNGALHFTWKLGKYKGSGVFELSDDGTSFEGSYKSAGSDDDGVWSGVRQ
jgi:hypothetical protein